MSSAHKFPAGVVFFPAHPSDEKTRKIQTTPSPMLEGQTAPLEAAALLAAFEKDPHGSLRIYEDKRFDVSGVAIAVMRDIHNLPTVRLSDTEGGRCCAHCIFPTDDVLQQVSVGDRVVIRANYLVLSNVSGIVMKFSELLSIEK